MTSLLHADRLLLSSGDLPALAAISLLAKPIVYMLAFGAYGLALRGGGHWAKALLAGTVRTALGYALGAVTMILVTSLPGPVVQILLGVCRFGLWFGLGRLFFPRASGRSATLFAVLGVALNLALDWTLLGGAVVAPA